MVIMFNSLTNPKNTATLYAPLTHSVVGVSVPHIGQKRPLFSTVVFLCSSINIKGLFPYKYPLVGCILRLRSAVPLCGTENLIQSAAQFISEISGGLLPNKGNRTMHTYTQKLTNNVRQNHLVSFFSVTLPNRATIAKHLTFTEALQLKNKLSNTCFIRFEKMGVMA